MNKIVENWNEFAIEEIYNELVLLFSDRWPKFVARWREPDYCSFLDERKLEIIKSLDRIATEILEHDGTKLMRKSSVDTLRAKVVRSQRN